MGLFFESYKERQIKHTQRVQVYRNLRIPGIVYSVRDAKTGLVLGHAEVILLSQCKFYVSEAGRQRVLASGHKNVHAWIEGHFVGPYYAGWQDDYGPNQLNTYQVRYNPWKNDSFITVNNEAMEAATLVLVGPTITAHDPKFKG